MTGGTTGKAKNGQAVGRVVRQGHALDDEAAEVTALKAKITLAPGVINGFTATTVPESQLNAVQVQKMKGGDFNYQFFCWYFLAVSAGSNRITADPSVSAQAPYAFAPGLRVPVILAWAPTLHHVSLTLSTSTTEGSARLGIHLSQRSRDICPYGSPNQLLHARNMRCWRPCFRSGRESWMHSAAYRLFQQLISSAKSDIRRNA